MLCGNGNSHKVVSINAETWQTLIKGYMNDGSLRKMRVRHRMRF